MIREFNIHTPSGKIFAVFSDGFHSDSAPLVILCHGLMMNCGQNPVRGISDGFNEAGYDTLRFDFRGSGLSDGKITEMTPLTEVDDLMNVVNYAVNFLGREDIVICGHSLGGLVSLLASAGMEKKGGSHVKGLVLFAPAVNIETDSKEGRVAMEIFDPINIPNEVAVWGSALGRCYFTTASHLDTFNAISCYTGPLCVLMGERDRLVTLNYAEKIKAALPQAELHVIPRGDHLFSRGIRIKAVETALAFMSGLK